jgi:subtilisin family serine protease
MKTILTLVTLLLSTNSFATTLVAVIDTGLDLKDPRLSQHLCKSGHQDFTGEGIKDTNGHGTHVVGLIEKYAKNADYCLYILKFWSKQNDDETNVNNYLKALDYAVNILKVRVVNISSGGRDDNEIERSIIIGHSAITFIVAAGNTGVNLDTRGNEYYPASYGFSNMRVVGSSCDMMSSFSNFGTVVGYWQCGENVTSTLPNDSTGQMHGTSQSTAIETGKYIYETHFSLN